MATLLAPSNYLHHLKCPNCDNTQLTKAANAVQCASCGASYLVSADGILEFVDLQSLDSATAEELQGNIYNLSPVKAAQIIQAEVLSGWRSYYARKRRRSMQQLARYLQRVSTREVFFLGVGSGREIAYLLHFMPLETLYCSDLSISVLRMVPERLKGTRLNVGLFTSDLQRCPIASSNIPVIIVAALHHTSAMHRTLEDLLSAGHDHLFLVEPISSLLTRVLARRGWAQRVEYSGLRPGRLELKTLKSLARQYGYQLSITTMWTFPDDYFARLRKRLRIPERLFFAFIDALSAASNWLHVGNGAVVHLQKVHAR